MKKRKIEILPIIRWIIVSLMLAVIILGAVFSCSQLYAKDKVLDELYDMGTYKDQTLFPTGILVEIPGYKKNFQQQFNSSDLGTLYTYKNADVFIDQTYDMRTSKAWFKEDYLAIIDSKIAEATTPEEVKKWESKRKTAEFDAESMFYLYMTNYFSDKIQKYIYVSIVTNYNGDNLTDADKESFVTMTDMLDQYATTYDVGREIDVYIDENGDQTENTVDRQYKVFVTRDQLQPLLDVLKEDQYSSHIASVESKTDTFAVIIHNYDLNYIKGLCVVLAAYMVLLLAFSLFRRKSMFNSFIPLKDKSSCGLPTYLCNILSYLTLGIFGVFMFIFEKKSRNTKQAAVQAMLVAIVTAIFATVTWAMFVIFSFMFDPVKNIMFTLQHVTWILTGGCFVYSLILSIFDRAFVLPVVGKLSVNSSYVD